MGWTIDCNARAVDHEGKSRYQYRQFIIKVFWNFSCGTPPLKGHLHPKVHMIFLFVTYVEGAPLFQGKGHFFWVLKPGFTSIQGTPWPSRSRDHKKSLISLNHSLVTMATAYLTWIDVLYLWKFNTQHGREVNHYFFHALSSSLK